MDSGTIYPVIRTRRRKTRESTCSLVNSRPSYLLPDSHLRPDRRRRRLRRELASALIWTSWGSPSSSSYPSRSRSISPSELLLIRVPADPPSPPPRPGRSRGSRGESRISLLLFPRPCSPLADCDAPFSCPRRRAFVYEGFLTGEECDHLVSLVGCFSPCSFHFDLGGVI